MLAKLHTFSLLGVEAVPVDAEADDSPAELPERTPRLISRSRWASWPAAGNWLLTSPSTVIRQVAPILR